jgi:hypothetical protein
MTVEIPMKTVLLASAFGLAFVCARLDAQNPPVTVAIDATADRHPINPLIYGVAYADAAALSDLNAPANRQGGNPTSRYNWQANVDNRGMDFYFESIPYASSTPGQLGDSFISSSKAGGAQPMLTIPMVGWVARTDTFRNKLASFSIAKYGPQTGNDWQYFPDAGNGILLNGMFVSGNDPNDANVPADALFQKAWVQHLVSTWGAAGAGGLSYYLLDNEPSIWQGAHRDVHPIGATMQEVRDKTVDYAGRIKDADPSALVVGPEEWGWSGYFYSGYDQQYAPSHNWVFPDRQSHGGADYLPWYLGQVRDASTAAGRRLLDVFSVHFYPQSGEFSDDTSTSMQLLRNRSTRSLWDPAYVDESWINDTVQLVPRLKGWVAAYYPGTLTALTEYNWGAEGHINGATAQADILGILGREGIDLATRWTTPAASTPTYKAIKIYRSYDGSHSTFGQTNVRAQAPDPDTLSAFAALRSSDGALTVMVVSKNLSGNTPLTLALAGFAARSPAQVWQLTAGNVITRLADVPVSAGAVSTSVPPQSVSLFVIPRAAGTAFYTVTPCRVLDTRDPAGAYGGPALHGTVARAFVLANQCGIPPSATAVSVNLAVTSPSSGGHLTVYPNGSSLPLSSTVNFRALQTRANNAILPLGAAGDIAVFCGMGAGETVHAILDVNGYFQ